MAFPSRSHQYWILRCRGMVLRAWLRAYHVAVNSFDSPIERSCSCFESLAPLAEVIVRIKRQGLFICISSEQRISDSSTSFLFVKSRVL